MPAAFARKINPATGDRAFDRTRRTFARALTPELALVQSVLRTPLGSAARDRTYGVRGVDNAVAVWRQNVLVALSRWVANGTLRDVDVTSVVVPLATGGSALAYAVTFKSRDGRVQTFNGRT